MLWRYSYYRLFKDQKNPHYIDIMKDLYFDIKAGNKYLDTENLYMELLEEFAELGESDISKLLKEEYELEVDSERNARRNEYHVVKQDNYMFNDDIHEAIVSEELWNQVHKKRQKTGVANIKTHSLAHEHILSGIIKCPICGSGMYGNLNRKKHPDAGITEIIFTMPASTEPL